MKRSWATGEIKRVRGVHCVRLDDETHAKAKKIAEERKLTIKEVITLAIENLA